MTFWISFLTTFAFVGSTSDRTFAPDQMFYSLYNPARIDSKETVSVKSTSSSTPRAASTVLNPLLKEIIRQPACSESMAATVRIRVKYPESESVGTGTIINTDGEQAVVLTCGHLFRSNESRHPVVIELFQEREVVQVSANVA